jgi:hypothetical protein
MLKYAFPARIWAMRSSIVATGNVSGGVVGFLMFAAVNEPLNVVEVPAGVSFAPLSCAAKLFDAPPQDNVPADRTVVEDEMEVRIVPRRDDETFRSVQA